MRSVASAGIETPPSHSWYGLPSAFHTVVPGGRDPQTDDPVPAVAFGPRPLSIMAAATMVNATTVRSVRAKPTDRLGGPGHPSGVLGSPPATERIDKSSSDLPAPPSDAAALRSVVRVRLTPRRGPVERRRMTIGRA